jgi:uncharacterized membrane protein
MQGAKVFAILLLIFLLIDLLWLGVVMKEFYSQQLGDLARREGTSLSPRWGAAILVYLLIPGGIVLFVRPLLGANSTTWQAFGSGAVFGLILYGVYDLTNLAVLDLLRSAVEQHEMIRPAHDRCKPRALRPYRI